jgi:hypothetical protein
MGANELHSTTQKTGCRSGKKINEKLKLKK